MAIHSMVVKFIHFILNEAITDHKITAEDNYDTIVVQSDYVCTSNTNFTISFVMFDLHLNFLLLYQIFACATEYAASKKILLRRQE